jgi:glycosyltransferase involved in cell wall biosynthesis
MDDVTVSVAAMGASAGGLSYLTDPMLDPIFWQAFRIGEPSAWWRHVPFAHWIMSACRPETFVELGTHAGVSYSAFCHAVQQAGLPTRCWAVDTWQGDQHAGAYDDSVFDSLLTFNESNYAAFSCLLRNTFDEALPRFADRSIDLLHIDGLHTYDAVKHDFESWRPKLSDRSVVVFHDTNVKSSDFGVWRLIDELRERYPVFEFLHGHGLGVVGIGDDLPPAILSLLLEREPAPVARIRQRFAWLGERWLSETRERMIGVELGTRAAAAAQAAQTAQAGAEHATAELARVRMEADEAVRQAGERSETLRREAAEASERASAQVAEASALLREQTTAAERAVQTRRLAETRSAEAEAMRALAAFRADRARQQADVTIRAADAARQDAEQLVESSREEAATSIAAARRDAARSWEAGRQWEAELASTRAQLDDAHREIAHLAGKHAQIENSTTWRATRPVRRIGQALPPGARRAVRGAAKLAWWSATFSLKRRLAARQALITWSKAQAALPEPVGTVRVFMAPAVDSACAPAVVYAGEPENVPAPPPALALRIVYVSGEFGTPGHRYRVERPAAAARMLGVAVTIVALDRIGDRLDAIAAAQVLVLWRTPWSEGLAAAVQRARAAGCKVVFDVDDLMIDPEIASNVIIDGIRSQHLKEAEVAAHYGRIRQTMRSADMCIATSEELVQHMRQAWMPARLLLNGFDHDTFLASRLATRAWARMRDGLVRIGYAGGSRTHQRDFAVCAEAVAEALRKHGNARLVLFRLGTVPVLDIEEFPVLTGLEDQIEWRDLVPLERLPEEMARFDINLAPLEIGNPFCEAKSELKYFEAALVDVPTIASATGPYRRAIRNGETGMLAETPEQWQAALGRLLDDPALRMRLSHAAHLDVIWTFGPERRLQEVATLLDLITGGRRGAEAFERQVLRAAAPVAARRTAPFVPQHEVAFDHDTLGVAKVTVIIPLYNYAGTVVEALHSVAGQTLVKLDLIIIDDRSTDNSFDVAIAWAEANKVRFNRLRVVRNASNVGLGFTRNLGMALADTPWVLPLDADNRLGSDCAAICLATAEQSGAAYVYPTIRQFGERTEVMGAAAYDPIRLSNGNYIDAMALISRAAWACVGGYDHIIGGWEDFDLWCRFAEHGLRGEQAPGGPLAEYRVHNTSMIQSAMASADRIDAMIKDIQRRHPWLTLVWPLASVERPSKLRAPLPKPTVAKPKRGIDRLLPILRCPTSGGRLSLSADETALVSESGVVWPLVEGRPNLFPGLGEPALHPDSHVSNPLPEKARDLTRSTRGLVLHLSAGGSAEYFDNVIEAEAAVFRHTDVLADAHRLPFADEMFEAVVAMNAFEHYRDPQTAAKEIMRILVPGGRVLIRTAFLQPEHEAPWHFYNCTCYGLAAWFEQFETEELLVSDNFHPGHSIAWLASECESALRSGRSVQAAEQFKQMPVGDLVTLWRLPEQARPLQAVPSWSDLAALPQAAQQKIAAGFEFLGRKPMTGVETPRRRLEG